MKYGCYEIMAIFIMRFLSKDHSKPNLYDNSIVTYLRQRYAKTLLIPVSEQT